MNDKKKKDRKKISCPLCNSNKNANKVMSYNGSNVVYVNYCSECCVEFENRGALICPIYA